MDTFRDKVSESWFLKLEPFFSSKECYDIFQYLKERSKTGNRVLPDSNSVFNAFRGDYNKLRLVMLSMEPYASLTFDNQQIADGLCFSCSRTKKPQPSLSKLMEGMENDTKEKFEPEFDYNLAYLRDEEGVLLGNISLTVEAKKIGSHQSQGLWLPLWKYLVEEVFNKYNNGLIYILLGKDSERIEKWIMPFNSHVLKASHPSFAARMNAEWGHNNVFSKATTILENANGKKQGVFWVKNLPF